MKKVFKKTQNLVKGTPTALLVSVGIHALILLLAGWLIVFTVKIREKATFVPQKIKRNPIELRKLRVKVKESAKPRKTAHQITSKPRSQNMPDIQLPEMIGMGSSLEQVGGFELLADLEKMTLFGIEKSLGNDLEGTLYHFLIDPYGRKASDASSGANSKFIEKINDFLNNGWSTKAFSEYYEVPRKLYATHLMIPPFPSELATKMFGMEQDVMAASFAIYYKGKIAHPTGGTFRFLGAGDDFMFVRINGKMVLDARTLEAWTTQYRTAEDWQSTSPEHRVYPIGGGHMAMGDWFDLEAGVPVEMEVLFGEDGGGRTWAMLNVQEQNVEYPINEHGVPIFPAFKTAPIPEHLIDEIEYTLIEGESDLENDLMFGAY